LKKILSIILMMLPLLTLTLASAFASTGNGGAGGITPDTFITASASVGGGWTHFEWHNATNAQPPLPGVSWSVIIIQVPVNVAPGSEVVLSIKVTDVANAGDSFELWSVDSPTAPASGTLIGTTPAVPNTGLLIPGTYDQCYLNPALSHGDFYFTVGQSGTYYFTVRVVTFATGFTSGGGGMKFEVTNSVGGYVIPSNDASILGSLLLPFALLGTLGLAVAYRKKLGF
jgi:hypothetical protein